MTKSVMTFGMAEETAIASAGDNRACSDGGDREDECSGCEGCGARNWVCYGGGSGLELLCMWGFGHIARHCRNRGRGRPMEGRRMEYSGGRIKEIFDNANNLKGGENLELLD